jgi:hypothetical protein
LCLLGAEEILSDSGKVMFVLAGKELHIREHAILS